MTGARDGSHADHGSRQPSRRIAAALRDAIGRRDYKPGQQLPSGSALMRQYGVARQTIQNAIDLLKAEGLVVGRSGAGVFVVEHRKVQRLSRNRLSRAAREAGRGAFLADASASSFEPSVDVDVRTEPADDRIAQALMIEPGAEVLVRDRVMRADGRPVQLAVSRLPTSITAGTAIEQVDTGRGGTYGALEAAGHPLDHFVESVAARQATHDEAGQLHLNPGSPVLAVTRIAYDASGTPVEINDMVLAGDRYELVYEIAAT